jgi:hypothetical protein
MTLSADDRVFELVALTVSGQRRERYFGPGVVPPGSPSLEQPDGGGTEQDPRRA